MSLYSRIKSTGCKIVCAVTAPFRAVTRALPSGIEMNKIAAAVLMAGLIAMVAGKVADVVYHGGGHHGEEKRGYTIAGAEEEPGAAPAADAGPVNIALFLSKADPAKGEGVHKACLTCHSFEKGGANKVGPNLYGIVGAKVAHAEGFAYSKAMAEHGGNWDFQTLSEFLTKPAKAIPGTKMAFAGVKDDQQRANLIAWLNQNSDSALPLPEAPAEGAAPGEGAGADTDAKETAPADAPTAAATEPDSKTAEPAPAPGEQTAPANASEATADPKTPAGSGDGAPVPEKTGAGTAHDAKEATRDFEDEKIPETGKQTDNVNVTEDVKGGDDKPKSDSEPGSAE